MPAKGPPNKNRENSQKSNRPGLLPSSPVGRQKMGSFGEAQAISFSSGWTSKLGSFGKSASIASTAASIPRTAWTPAMAFDGTKPFRWTRIGPRGSNETHERPQLIFSALQILTMAYNL